MLTLILAGHSPRGEGLNRFPGRRLLPTIFAVFVTLPVLSQSVTITAPASGATVGTSIHVTASATGGTHPISATRLYLDNTSVTTVSGSKLNAYASATLGSHKLTVVSWDTTGRSIVSAEYVKVIVPGKVTITSPTTASTVSPVHF